MRCGPRERSRERLAARSGHSDRPRTRTGHAARSSGREVLHLRRDGSVPLRSAGSSGRRRAADRQRSLRRVGHDALGCAASAPTTRASRRPTARTSCCGSPAPANRRRRSTAMPWHWSTSNARLRHCRSRACGLPATASSCRVSSSTGHSHRVRLETYLPGTTFEDGQVVSLPSLWAIGELLGGVTAALADFDHPAAWGFMPWDIANGLVVDEALNTALPDDARGADRPRPPADRHREGDDGAAAAPGGPQRRPRRQPRPRRRVVRSRHRADRLRRPGAHRHRRRRRRFGRQPRATPARSRARRSPRSPPATTPGARSPTTRCRRSPTWCWRGSC